MEMKSIEFYKWEKQKALIIKYNTVDPYSEIYFAHYIPFQQITKSGFSSSDFDIFEETKYGFIINCPRICKEYKIVVSKVQIKKITIKEPKELFDILSYIENFNKEAKTRINKIIHTYLNIS